MVEQFPQKFYGKQMAEERYNNFGVDLKEGREDTGWGKIDSLLMPIIDIQEEYSLPIQSPEALLYGLLKKRKALEGKSEQEIVN